VLVPGGVFPQPAITQQTTVTELIVEENASLFVNAHIVITSQLSAEGTLSGVGSYTLGTNETINLSNTTQAELFVYPNPSEEEPIYIGVNGSLDNVTLNLRLLSSDGKVIATFSGLVQQINSELGEMSVDLAKGVYYIQCTYAGNTNVLKWVKQ